MGRMRSPSYPSIHVGEAIEYTKKIYDKNRSNPISREAAAKDMGYTGLSGRSAKVLADLAHFKLVEGAGKGGLKVTGLAVDILYPSADSDQGDAIRRAAFSPELYSKIQEQFPSGPVSENALRSYLMRLGFTDVAINPAISGYMETMRYLGDDTVSDSRGVDEKKVEESKLSERLVPQSWQVRPHVRVVPHRFAGGGDPMPHPSAGGQPKQAGVRLLENERVVFMDESGPSQYVKLVASGDVDETLLDALSSYVERQKKRLTQQAAQKAATEAQNASSEEIAADIEEVVG